MTDTTGLYDKYGKRIYINNQTEYEPTNGGVGQIIFGAVAMIFTIGLSVTAYQIWQIKMAGKETTLHNIFTLDHSVKKTDEQIKAEIREQEREYYYQEAVKHYSETYAIKHARTLALKDTNAFFAARDKGRADALKKNEALIDNAENFVESGGFIKNISYLIDSPSIPVSNNTYSDTPLPKPVNTYNQNTNVEVDIDLEAMQKRNKEVVSNIKQNKKKVIGKYSVPSSLPSNMGSGRKAILRGELNQKQLQLEVLETKLQTADASTASKLKAEINRVNGDINALNKEMKM